MSLRIDTAELIAGAHVVGETGLGVLAENIPDDGLHGASYLFNDVTLPADNGKEIRGLIVTPPADGTFYAWEDGSFSLVGAADGAYTFIYRLYVDGVDQGTATAAISIGEVTSGDLGGNAALGDVSAGGGLDGGDVSVLSGGAALGDVAASGGMDGGDASDVSGGATLDDATADGAIAVEGPSILSGGAALGDVSAAGDGSGGGATGDVSGAASLGDVSASGDITGAPGELSGEASLGDATGDALMTGGQPSVLSGSATLGGVSASGIAGLPGISGRVYAELVATGISVQQAA